MQWDIMKLYKILPCDNYTEINNQIKQYIESTGIVAVTNNFWNVLPTVEFIQAVPLFQEWTQTIGIRIKSLALTVGRTPSCCSIHIDTPPAVFKLSWPITNTANTFNRWFKPIVETPDIRINELGGQDLLNINQFEEIEKKELLSPCIINAGVPHDVWVNEHAQYPRLGLQCQLFKEPTSL